MSTDARALHAERVAHRDDRPLARPGRRSARTRRSRPRSSASGRRRPARSAPARPSQSSTMPRTVARPPVRRIVTAAAALGQRVAHLALRERRLVERVEAVGCRPAKSAKRERPVGGARRDADGALGADRRPAAGADDAGLAADLVVRDDRRAGDGRRRRRPSGRGPTSVPYFAARCCTLSAGEQDDVARDDGAGEREVFAEVVVRLRARRSPPRRRCCPPGSGRCVNAPCGVGRRAVLAVVGEARHAELAVRRAACARRRRGRGPGTCRGRAARCRRSAAGPARLMWNGIDAELARRRVDGRDWPRGGRC